MVNVYEKVTGKLLVVFSQNVSTEGESKWEELSIGLTAKVAVDIEVICENTSTTAVFFDNLEVKVQAVATVIVVQENIHSGTVLSLWLGNEGAGLDVAN